MLTENSDFSVKFVCVNYVKLPGVNCMNTTLKSDHQNVLRSALLCQFVDPNSDTEKLNTHLESTWIHPL